MTKFKRLRVWRGMSRVVLIALVPIVATVLIAAAPIGGPANDQCADAIPVAVPSVTQGTTVGSTVDGGFQTCGVPVTSPGVWYSVVGTGNTMTASLCAGTDYDSRLTVYCNLCDTPTCVSGDEDGCNLQSIVTWCSQQDAVYLILVHGFGIDDGDFTLTLSDDGVSCDNAVNCTGADICEDASGDCCDKEGNGTPGCNNSECCFLICEFDPHCCETAWDASCGFQAFFLCDVCLNPPKCPWDLNESGVVDTSDLLALFAQWGTAGSADFDGNGTVDTSDLLTLFANWGVCK